MFLLAFLPVLIIFIIIAYLVYMGAFLPIPIEEKNVGPFHFLYKDVNGKDFSLIGKTSKEIADELKQYNFNVLKPMQIFYPEEDKKPVEVGFIIEEQLTDLPNLQVKTIPATLCLMTTFPWRNSISFVFGFMKVDPALQSFRNSKNYKKTEVLVLLDEHTIHYFQPIK